MTDLESLRAALRGGPGDEPGHLDIDTIMRRGRWVRRRRRLAAVGAAGGVGIVALVSALVLGGRAAGPPSPVLPGGTVSPSPTLVRLDPDLPPSPEPGTPTGMPTPTGDPSSLVRPGSTGEPGWPGGSSSAGGPGSTGDPAPTVECTGPPMDPTAPPLDPSAFPCP